MKKLLFGKAPAVFLLAVLLLAAPAGFGQIIGWDATGVTGFGGSPFLPATLNPNLTTSGLIRGGSIGIGGTSAASCWGGAGGWAATQSDGNSFYFTFQASAGYKVSLSAISSATRRSNGGPTGCIVSYSVGNSSFVNAASWTTSSTSGTNGTPNNLSLAGIPALQDIPAGTVVKFRITPQGSTTGNYYITGGANCLKIDGTVAIASSPLITTSTASLPPFGNVIVGSFSAAQDFTFDTVGLTGDVTLVAPAGFQISTDNTNWFESANTSGIGGILSDKQIWVRFNPSLAGPYTGAIVLSSPGAENQMVSVSGTGLAVGLTVSPALINTLSYIENEGPSAAVQLTQLVSGGLAPSSGNIDVAPLSAASNYELSTDGISWSPSIQLPYTAADNTIDNPAIYVRLKAGLAAGEVAPEQIDITGGSFSTFFTVAGNVYPEDMVLEQAFCGSATASQLSAPGSSVLWYTTATGGSPLAPAQALVTGSYYVSLNGGSRIEVGVTINPVPPLPSAVAQAFCTGAIVGDLAVVSGSNISWYTTPTGGAALAVGTVMTTGTYYASQRVNDCESARKPVPITINALPEAPAALPQSFCNAAIVADLVPVPFAGTGAPAIQESWPGFVAYGFSGQQTMAGTSSTGLNYYFTDFTKSPATPVPVMTAIETLSAFNQLKSITILAAAPNDSPAGTNKNLYITKTVNGVETALATLVLSATLSSYTVMVNGYDAGVHIKIAKDPAMTVFQMQTLQFDFYQTGEGVSWYSAETGGNALLPSDALVAGTYYVSQSANTCESTRTPVAISIGSPAQPQGAAMQEYTEGQTLADLEVTGDNLVWYANADLTGPLAATTSLVGGTTYYVVGVQGECVSLPLVVTAIEQLGAPVFSMADLRYYPNPINDALNIDYTAAISSVAIYNILGQQMIAEAPHRNSATIDTSRLESGVYFVKITSGTASKTIKVIRK